MRFLIFILALFAMPSMAAEEVKIYGKANTQSGKPIEALFDFEEQTPPKILVIEPKPNIRKPQQKILPDTIKANKIKEIDQWSAQNPKPFSISPEAQKNEIENTLYEGGDRIYDVQSFPLKDIKTITEPNIDPTISTYPEY